MDTSLYKSHTTQRNLTYNYYFSKATGSKSTILFLHGFPSSSFDWRHQVLFFQEKGYGILVPDLLGAGKTSHPVDVSAFRLSAMAADVVSILDTEGLEKVVGVAHDWGSLLLSSLSTLYKKRFTGFVWLALSYLPPNQEPINFLANMEKGHPNVLSSYAYWEYFTDESSVEEIKQNVESFMQLLYPKDPSTWSTYMAVRGKTAEWMHNNMRPGRPEYLTDSEFERICKTFLETGVASPILWYKANIDEINLEDNKRISREEMTVVSPSLFIGASRDFICTPDIGKRNMTEFCTNPTILEFDTGHRIHLEIPDVINEAINNWLNETNL